MNDWSSLFRSLTDDNVDNVDNVVIKEDTLLAAAKFVSEYAMPMAERVRGR
jgi:hypothetical protein